MGLLEGMGLATANAERKWQEDQASKERKFQKGMTREDSVLKVLTSDSHLDVQQDKELIRWQQEMNSEIREVVYKLKGWVQNDQGNWIEPEKCEPLANDLFINNIIVSECKPYLSKNFINSNMDENRLLIKLKGTMKSITNSMADGYDRFGIKFIDYDIILDIIKGLIVPAAYRAINGWTKKTDSTITKSIHTVMDTPQQPQKKWVPGF